MRDLARRLQVDLHAVFGTAGIPVVVLGLAQLLPTLVALARGEPPWGLALGAVGTIAVGLLLIPLRAQGRKWTRRESLAVVAISWLAAGAAASVPFMTHGGASLVDALFESVSGLSTTGATVFPDVDAIPAPLHLWRALCHWLGGAGIVLIVLVLTPWLDNADALRRTQQAEASFLTERYHGSTRATLRGLLMVYVGATILLTALLVALGLGAFEAVLHAFATISTGGFSTRTASLGAWGPAVQLVVTAFMVLGALNFAFLGRAAAGGGLRYVFRSSEVRYYLWTLAFLCVFMSALLFFSGDAARYRAQGPAGAFQAFVDATFTTVAISTTTGFCTENYASWPAVCQVVLLGLMIVGGCSGSTAGGIKFRRAMIIVKHGHREIRQLIHPRAVLPIVIDGREVTETEVRSALSYLTTYVCLVLLLMALVALTGSDPVTAGGAAASSFGSIGPGFGDVDPAGSFQPLAPSAKLLCLFGMLLGRLEIYPLLAVLLPSFWLHRRRRGGRDS